jgi:hypothetical protein
MDKRCLIGCKILFHRFVGDRGGLRLIEQMRQEFGTGTPDGDYEEECCLVRPVLH